MALNENERMTTRQKQYDYFLLNDGLDEAALPEDQITESFQSDLESFISFPSSEILPSESVSQTLARSSSFSTPSQRRPRAAPVTNWMWDYFQVTEVAREWIIKRTQKRKPTDRDIQCAFIDGKTGIQCPWKTSDSLRQTSTTNMQRHLEKHSIFPPSQSNTHSKSKEPNILNLLTNQETLSVQQRLEKNLIQWVIQDKQAFTVIESSAFQQIFEDIPGISLPFLSRSTLRRRLIERFDLQRSQLKEDLAKTCKTIAFSLDIWTSQNHLPILGIIGHWLTEDFEYREETLEFCELYGTHSGENIAAAIHKTLVELNLESKLITITGDNASNNEVMVSELFHILTKESSQTILFQGLDSYIRCLAHILNLIVKDILRSLKSGNVEEAHTICDNLRAGESISSQTALAKLRILALWIARSPQKRQDWKELCQIMNLSDKFIEYDVETRWNSTFRMLDDGLKAKAQIDRFLAFHTEIPPFSNEEWLYLSQIHQLLAKFDELTLLLSEQRPQISLAVPIYYELYDLLHEGSSGLDYDIASAMKEGMKKYKKYYTFMDESDTYYTSVILDPRVKGDLILSELDDKEAGNMILTAIRENLHQKYPRQGDESRISFQRPTLDPLRSSIESRMLQRLQPQISPMVSDIDQYFDSPRVNIIDTVSSDWLCTWWRTHKGELPQMAAAARDFLAIPASEVAVERLFSTARDLLGVRRHGMKADTMRILMLIK